MVGGWAAWRLREQVDGQCAGEGDRQHNWVKPERGDNGGGGQENEEGLKNDGKGQQGGGSRESVRSWSQKEN